MKLLSFNTTRASSKTAPLSRAECDASERSQSQHARTATDGKSHRPDGTARIPAIRKLHGTPPPWRWTLTETAVDFVDKLVLAEATGMIFDLAADRGKD